MPLDLPNRHLKLLKTLACNEGEGLAIRYLGSILTHSGLPSASASGAARNALKRLCRLGLVSSEAGKQVATYRITAAGRLALALADHVSACHESI